VIGLDTNVIERYLAQVDVRQAAIATRLIKGSYEVLITEVLDE